MNLRIPFSIYSTLLILLCIMAIILVQLIGWVLHSDVLMFVSARNSSSDIYLLDINRDRTMRMTNTLIDEGWARWSPDGQQIVYIADDLVSTGIHVFTMDSYGHNLTQLTTGNSINWFPTWSLDGMFLAISTGQSHDNTDMIIINAADGTVQRRLPDFGAQERVTAWFNNRLLFTVGDLATHHIYTVATDGSDLRQLTPEMLFNFNPVWSPDGQRIAFQSNPDGDFDIYVMNTDGTDVRRLTDNNADESSPMWSSDGTRIAYMSETGVTQAYQLYMMNADGTNQRRLTNNDFQDSSPAWMP